MAVLRVLLCLALCGLASAVALPTHDQVLQLLQPRSDEIRSWVIHQVIGQSQSPRAEKNPLLCATCELAVTLALSFVEQGTEDDVATALTALCIDLNLFPADICEGAIEGFVPHAYHILTSRPLTADDVCGVLLQNLDCGVVNETMTNWEVSIAGNKPQPSFPISLPADLPTAKVLHVTDIHLDLDYAEGSLTECGKPMCCRRGENWEEPWNSSVEAGVYGDYNCDIPEHAMQNAFDDAATRYNDYEFVVLGGDYVHHGVWLTTQESILEHFGSVSRGIHAAFPDTPIYPIIGNHESHPTNVFPPSSIWAEEPEFDISWLYGTLADLYATQLTPEALVTFRRAGYYTVLHRPGLRVITLNSNFCYTLNFWILYESADPEGQLQWFSDQMNLAELNNEKVFILGHIPPGGADCWSVWNNHFNAIVNRYQNIILAQFYGHTHNDDFKIFFDENQNPNAAAFISPSVTPYTDINAAYKVFHFDGARDEESTWELVDYETYTYNLTQANEGDLDWFMLYSAKEAYGLTSLRPADLLDFVLRMAGDNTLFQEFYRNYNRNSGAFEPCEDAECVREILCALLTSNDNDRSQCDRLDEPIRQRRH